MDEIPGHLFQLSDLKLALSEYAKVYEDAELFVVGSMSILGLSGQIDLSPSLLTSSDLDIYPKTATQNGLLAREHFGLNSDFFKAHGFIIEGVGDWTTMTTPPGWQERTIPIRTSDGVVGYCLAPIDCAFNKIEAARPKDISYVQNLLLHELVHVNELKAVIELYSGHPENKTRNLRTLEQILDGLNSTVKTPPTHPALKKEDIFMDPSDLHSKYLSLPKDPKKPGDDDYGGH